MRSFVLEDLAVINRAMASVSAPSAPMMSLDRAAMRALYEEHAPPVLRYLRGVLRSVPLAEEATQETFVRVFSGQAQQRQDGRTLPWLLGVAHHVALETYRKQRRGSPRSASAPQVDHRTPEDWVRDAQAARLVLTAIDALPADQRAALLLRIDQGASYEEIARVVGCSVAKAKVDVCRARKALRVAVAAALFVVALGALARPRHDARTPAPITSIRAPSPEVPDGQRCEPEPLACLADVPPVDACRRDDLPLERFARGYEGKGGGAEGARPPRPPHAGGEARWGNSLAPRPLACERLATSSRPTASTHLPRASPPACGGRGGPRAARSPSLPFVPPGKPL